MKRARHVSKYKRGPPPKKNPLKLSSGGQVHCCTSSLSYMSILETHLYQCTGWHCCERLGTASVNFYVFRNSFNVFAHFMMGDLHVHLTILCWVFSNFWPKMAWSWCPNLSIYQISPQVTFFFVSPEEKSPPKETFC